MGVTDLDSTASRPSAHFVLTLSSVGEKGRVLALRAGPTAPFVAGLFTPLTELKAVERTSRAEEGLWTTGKDVSESFLRRVAGPLGFRTPGSTFDDTGLAAAPSPLAFWPRADKDLLRGGFAEGGLSIGPCEREFDREPCSGQFSTLYSSITRNWARSIGSGTLLSTPTDPPLFVCLGVSSRLAN